MINELRKKDMSSGMHDKFVKTYEIVRYG